MAVRFILRTTIFIVLVVYCCGTPVPEPHPHHDHYDYRRPVQYIRPQRTVFVQPVVAVRPVPVVAVRPVPLVAAPIQYGYG